MLRNRRDVRRPFISFMIVPREMSSREEVVELAGL